MLLFERLFVLFGSSFACCAFVFAGCLSGSLSRLVDVFFVLKIIVPKSGDLSTDLELLVRSERSWRLAVQILSSFRGKSKWSLSCLVSQKSEFESADLMNDFRVLEGKEGWDP